MPIKFLEDDEVTQPIVSDSLQTQQPTQQKKTIRFLDDNPPIQQAQPLTYHQVVVQKAHLMNLNRSLQKK